VCVCVCVSVRACMFECSILMASLPPYCNNGVAKILKHKVSFAQAFLPHSPTTTGLWSFGTELMVCCSVLQCVAVCCSVLQCVAVCCNVCRDSLQGLASAGRHPKLACLFF